MAKCRICTLDKKDGDLNQLSYYISLTKRSLHSRSFSIATLLHFERDLPLTAIPRILTIRYSLHGSISVQAGADWDCRS